MNLALQLSYYPLGAQVMTMVLPLGWFIVVIAAMYVVFTRPHSVPGRRPITGARPVAPADPGRAASLAAATGLPTATAAGGPEPLAERGTPPPLGLRTEEAIKQAAEEAAAEAKNLKDKVTGESGEGQDVVDPALASDEAAFGGTRQDKTEPDDHSEDAE